MTIGQWIAQYCAQNDIELPTGMDEYNTQLNFLQLDNKGTGINPDGRNYTYCNVTFEYSGAYIFQIAIPHISNDGIKSIITQADIALPVECVLYKGKATINTNMGIDFASCTGNCTLVNSSTAIITGDCTITLSV